MKRRLSCECESFLKLKLLLSIKTYLHDPDQQRNTRRYEKGLSENKQNFGNTFEPMFHFIRTIKEFLVFVWNVVVKVECEWDVTHAEKYLQDCDNEWRTSQVYITKLS